MTLWLIREARTANGIFGKLATDDTNLCATLEHAYPAGDSFEPKVPSGLYTCRRGQHQLHSGPIETFEIEDVPGHSGILFHPGNTQDDSEGCVLLGRVILRDTLRDSRNAFHDFMERMVGLDTFQLLVVDAPTYRSLEEVDLDQSPSLG